MKVEELGECVVLLVNDVGEGGGRGGRGEDENDVG